MNNKPEVQKLYQPNQRTFPFSIGDTNGVAQNSRVLHWHKEMEICRIKSGSGKYLINGKEYDFTEGDVFLINNDEIHLCFDDRELVIQVVMFDPSFIWSGGNNLLDYEYLKPFLETERNFSNKLNRENIKIELVINTLQEIEDEYNHMNDSYELMIKSLLLKLMTLIIRYFKISDMQYGASISPRISQKIRQVIEYIDLYYGKSLKISELACITQMSVPHFCHTFKTLVGIPPMEFIIRKRVSAAKEALKNTDQRILFIAGECGFNSISNFNHLFREYTGFSPSAYRKS